MSCSIPNFNLAFSALYDLSGTIPQVVITNQSTGSNLSNIIYYFELITPNSTIYHQGSFALPDKTGGWTTFNVAEQIPVLNGQIDFSSNPYKIKCYAKDNLGNICELEKLDIICAPNGVLKNTNFGNLNLDLFQECDKGRLRITDISNYLYKGITGLQESSLTTFVYPATESGVTPANAVVQNLNAFTIPIPINGKGHQLIRNSIYKYQLSTGNFIRVKYKYKKDDLEINCFIDTCSLLCGLTKYREKLTSDPKCDGNNFLKISDLQLKISTYFISIVKPNCGFDSNSLLTEIKDELFKNDCICDCKEQSGNNQVTSLECHGLDIACIWDSIKNYLNANVTPKSEFCQIVSDCIAAQNANACSQPLITSFVFSTTSLFVNFLLSNQANSNSLKVYYKLSSSSTWILAATLASTATSYSIAGSFTVGAIYEVKVENNCTSNAIVSSSILSSPIPPVFDSCYFMSLIYTGLANGIYGIEVNNAQTPCKYTPKLLDANFIGSLLPCHEPFNVKIDSGATLTFTGIPGNYEISYKLKSVAPWTVYSTAAYTGIDHIVPLGSLSLSPLQDYEFRVVKKCSSSDSLPIYTDYELSQAQCKSAGDFISFNETTGALVWAGNGNGSATYVFSAYLSGSFLPLPTSITLSSAGNIVTANYSNILGLLSIGDVVTFRVYQDCGGGNQSSIQSHSYEMIGDIEDCPEFKPGWSYNTIANDVIIVNTGGGGVPDPKILFTQYEIKVNGAFAGTGVLVNDGGYVTKVKSLIKIKTGDTVGFRYRSYGNTQQYRVTAATAWSTFASTIVTVVDGWSDEWIEIPTPWYNADYEAGAFGAYYKIDSNGKLRFSGSVIGHYTLPTTSGATINSFVETIFTVPAPILSLLNPLTLVNTRKDAYGVGATNYYTSTFESWSTVRELTRNIGVFAITCFFRNLSGSAISNGVEISISNISIE